MTVVIASFAVGVATVGIETAAVGHRHPGSSEERQRRQNRSEMLVHAPSRLIRGHLLLTFCNGRDGCQPLG